jgi:glyoxylase-like metal-dependent hydrolase (beta-lactamase superfamily II)
MIITPITLNYFFGVNSYLMETETGFYLIDTGFHKKRIQLEKELQKAGCKTRNLKLIILTHGHTDHVSNAAYLREKYGAKIAMHKGDSKMVKTGNMFVDAKGGLLFRLIVSFMKLLGLSSFEKFVPDIYLEDNQDLSKYGLNVVIIHTPGHSKGSISIMTDERDLFCGDILGNTKYPEKTTLIDDLDQLNASIENIKALETLMVYPGHGKPFKMDQFTN